MDAAGRRANARASDSSAVMLGYVPWEKIWEKKKERERERKSDTRAGISPSLSRSLSLTHEYSDGAIIKTLSHWLHLVCM